MSFSPLVEWVGGFVARGVPEGIIHLVLGIAVGIVAWAWVAMRRSLTSVHARSAALADRLESQALRLAELEGARWDADPEARVRRDDELVQVLGSLLSYTDSVRNGGASAAPDQEGEAPCE